jgi:dynein heavy chain
MNKGLWIVLQNCHLVPSFNPVIEKIYDSINEKTQHLGVSSNKDYLTPDQQLQAQPQNVNVNFRLWLTLQSTPNFPHSILKRGI